MSNVLHPPWRHMAAWSVRSWPCLNARGVICYWIYWLPLEILRFSPLSNDERKVMPSCRVELGSHSCCDVNDGKPNAPGQHEAVPRTEGLLNKCRWHKGREINELCGLMLVSDLSRMLATMLPLPDHWQWIFFNLGCM